eukprot:Nk52_evm58s226 gene=Nk52_evmTU58s226
MSKPIDYSRWNNIEVSDDEDDTHPNIDKESLWRWKKQARLEREAKEAHEKRQVIEGRHSREDAITELKKKIQEISVKDESSEELKNLKKELRDCEDEYEKFKKKEEELIYQETHFPKWSSSNICRDGFNKSSVGKFEEKPKDEDLTDEQLQERYTVFVCKNEKKIKMFGMLSKLKESEKFFLENNTLVCDDTANYLVVWAIDLEIEGKCELMKRVCHQCVLLQYLLELLKPGNLNPRDVIRNFFHKMDAETQDIQHRAFDDDLKAFIERVQKRAVEKKAEREAEAEEVEEDVVLENPEDRLGPGGLDPIEVANSLPRSLQEAFEARDVDMLKDALAKMTPSEAKYHIKRCADSGLWVPDPEAAAELSDGSS